jgi:hypothetical protein
MVKILLHLGRASAEDITMLAYTMSETKQSKNSPRFGVEVAAPLAFEQRLAHRPPK